MSDLRNQLIRLAYRKAHLRPHLLPIIVQSSEGINIATTPVDEARAYAGKHLDVGATWPHFEQNYRILRDAISEAKGLSRAEMPVIEPEDMTDFTKALQTKQVQILRPGSNLPYTGDIEIGFVDTPIKGQGIQGKMCSIRAGEIIPTQSEIWLDKVVSKAAEFGPVEEGDSLLKMTVLVSKEGHLLDGHHRYAATILSDPDLKMKALMVPISIDTLLEIGREYSKKDSKD